MVSYNSLPRTILCLILTTNAASVRAKHNKNHLNRVVPMRTPNRSRLHGKERNLMDDCIEERRRPFPTLRLNRNDEDLAFSGEHGWSDGEEEWDTSSRLLQVPCSVSLDIEDNHLGSSSSHGVHHYPTHHYHGRRGHIHTSCVGIHRVTTNCHKESHRDALPDDILSDKRRQSRNCNKNGGTPLSAYIDTGATHTVMSYAALLRSPFAHLLDRRYAGTATGVGQCNVLGRIPANTVLLTLGTGTKKVVVSCPAIIILEDGIKGGVEMLLGLDALKEWGAGICLRGKTLTVRENGVGKGVAIPFVRSGPRSEGHYHKSSRRQSEPTDCRGGHLHHRRTFGTRRLHGSAVVPKPHCQNHHRRTNPSEVAESAPPLPQDESLQSDLDWLESELSSGGHATDESKIDESGDMASNGAEAVARLYESEMMEDDIDNDDEDYLQDFYDDTEEDESDGCNMSGM